ncbi:MAG: RrF2 family transcriptional regulator [Chitinophagaceae bacterium]
MLSISCKAAIKAVVFLGLKSHTQEKKSIKEIAESIEENEHTVGKILQKLVKANILKSTKGPTGGFFITNEQTELPVIHIVTAIDGDEIFESCGLGLVRCFEQHPCPLHHDFIPIRSAFKKMCLQKKIYELYKDVYQGKSFLTS